MTPEERAIQVWLEIISLMAAVPMSWGGVAINTACAATIAAAIRAAINAKLDEVADELEKLERGTYTTAVSAAELVRRMKVK
jgi:hypothetical protein